MLVCTKSSAQIRHVSFFQRDRLRTQTNLRVRSAALEEARLVEVVAMILEVMSALNAAVKVLSRVGHVVMNQTMMKICVLSAAKAH